MKAVLMGVEYHHMPYDIHVSMQELQALANACHIEVIHMMTQKLSQISPQYYIGRGKVEELKEYIDDCDIIIFNEELTPLQVKNLTDALDVEISDRSDLILRIFESRAKTQEAKLQVQIARLQYVLPRLAGMKSELYSQQGGSGFRGSGEKQIELDRRHIHRQLLKAKRELATIVKHRQTQRKARKRHQEKVVCLVGYTNSGKSSLLNIFTQKKVFQEDMLFASLQTASRKVLLRNHYPIIMSDTVGLISQLPHHLVQAFRSTLEEITEADLLLHVIDASSPYCEEQIHTTIDVLHTLGVTDTPMIYVYNKMDKGLYHLIHHEPYIDISVKERIHIDELEDMVIEMLFKDYEITELIIPYDQGIIFQELKQKYELLKEDYLEEGIYLSLFMDQKEKKKYEEYFLGKWN